MPVIIRQTIAPKKLGGPAAIAYRGRGAQARLLLKQVRKFKGVIFHQVKHNSGQVSLYVQPWARDFVEKIVREIGFQSLINGSHSIFQAKILPAIRQREMTGTVNHWLAA